MWQEKLLVNMLSDIQYGTIVLKTPQREYTLSGPHQGLDCVWEIFDWKVVNQLLFSGEIGLGESYKQGLWRSNDLTKLLIILNHNEKYFGGGYNKNFFNKIMGYWQHRNNANTKKQATKNIKHHYDLGNDFYSLWLDNTMAYSSALFDTQTTKNYLKQYQHEKPMSGQEFKDLNNKDINDTILEKGQYQKFDNILQKLNLNETSHLLEIGSGWGAFACYASEKTGCKVTSITLSEEQKKQAEALSFSKHLSSKVKFIIQDYRDVKDTYDAVVSIEMYEAVGEAYWDKYFNVIRKALKPHGVAVIQGITINPSIFDYYKTKWDFIQKYIFPGGMLCTPGLFQDIALKNNLVTEEFLFFADSYAQTLQIWQKNVDNVEAFITKKFSEEFYLMWRYYLSYCEAGFLHKKIDVMQIVLKPYPYETI